MNDAITLQYERVKAVIEARRRQGDPKAEEELRVLELAFRAGQAWQRMLTCQRD